MSQLSVIKKRGFSKTIGVNPFDIHYFLHIYVKTLFILTYYLLEMIGFYKQNNTFLLFSKQKYSTISLCGCLRALKHVNVHPTKCVRCFPGRCRPCRAGSFSPGNPVLH